MAIFSLLFIFVGILGLLDSDFFIALCEIGFGGVGLLYFIIQFFFTIDNSGIILDLQGFEVHTAEGRKYRYQFRISNLLPSNK